MSKYKVGDKFILEVGEVYGAKMPLGAETDSPVTLYKAKGFNSLVFDAKELDKLEKYEGKTATELEDAAFEQGVNEGLEMAWKWIRKIGRMSSEDMDKVFGKKFFYTTDIIENMTPQEVLAKLEAYEKEQAEIKVGDVIESGNKKGIALQVYEFSGYTKVNILLQDGEIEMADYTYDWKKTGKHIDIAGILEELGKE